uniref:SWIRM domain-containing protein n=2 Tax=Lutzomyia longipalpis TaxID=7200 RepID=A0A1B0CU30_LUTLO
MSKITEEEEEIDIIGDYEREISNISSGQILSCEYTVHPRWLTDNADLWAESGKDAHPEIELSEEISELEWTNQQISDNLIVLDKDLPVTIQEEVVASSSNNAGKPKKTLLHPKREFLKKSLHLEIFESSSQSNVESNERSRLPSLSEMSDCDSGSKCSQRIPAETVSLPPQHPKDVVSPKRKKLRRKHTSRPPRHKKSHQDADIIGENITIIHDLGQPNTRDHEEWNNGEIERKPSSTRDETDEEVDIETEDHPVELKIPLPENSHMPSPVEEKKQDSPEKVPPRREASQEIKEILDSEEIPQEELKINPNEITPIEKYIFAEFFDGRQTKTPDRFLKIRTHIINSWINAKPSYVGKTAVRNGLKNCGDVNCISRIHTFLEQVGVINFGHSGEYFHYIRPLWRLLDAFTTVSKKSFTPADGKVTAVPTKRNRIRYSEGVNMTIQHTEETLLRIPAARAKNQQQWKRSRDIELVKCRKFSPTEIPPFSVKITLGTLLCLHLHSLSSHYEVMGFLGGHRHSNTIFLQRYKPCRTSKQSGTMCEMCPVSQVEQADSLIMGGFQLLGWFHSHPLFPPNPSRMDIETQGEIQRLFSADDTPFMGFILGCVEMNFKCIYILDESLDSESAVYEIDVEIIPEHSDLQSDLRDILPFCGKLNEQTVQKFKDSARTLLQQQGLSCDIENLLNFSSCV